MRGRPKGSTNHDGKLIKEMIYKALDEMGGVEYLKQQAVENANAFLGLVGRVIPKDVEMTVRRSILEEAVVDESAGASTEAYH